MINILSIFIPNSKEENLTSSETLSFLSGVSLLTQGSSFKSQAIKIFVYLI